MLQIMGAKMRSGFGQLISFNNVNGLELIGLLFAGKEQPKTIALHIHGNYGNFYNNKFLWTMSHRYVENGIDFLTFNLSSHDGLCEGYDNGVLRYIGGAVADYNESIFDIDSAVNYVRELGYTNIVLQGHSLGCDKVIEYALAHRDDSLSLILLSPVDSYAVQKKWLNKRCAESIDEQIARLRVCNDGSCLDWVAIDEYGAEGMDTDWVYQIPVTRSCLISLLQGSAFKYLNIECGEDFIIYNRSLAFLGKSDGLQMHTQSDFGEFLRLHFTQLCLVNDLDSDHDIKGVEAELTGRIVEWVKLLSA